MTKVDRVNQALALLLLFASAHAQAPQQPARSSVSGVVREAASGAPITDARVQVFVSNQRTISRTDSQGRYKLSDLPPGEYVVAAAGPDLLSSTQVRITVGPGQDVENLDIRLVSSGTITGRVLDENKEPLPGMVVFLVERTYRLGELHYSMSFSRPTNDKGEYWLRAVPGRAYLLLAKKWETTLRGISEAPADPKLRKPALASTYYPNAASVQAAQMVTLHPGETRENVDILVARKPSYCIDGAIHHASPGFWLIESGFTLATLPSDLGVIVAFQPPGGKAGADGKFRICDLHPDQYRFAAIGVSANGPPAAIIVPLTVADSDIHNLELTPAPGPPLRGELVWDSPPPRGTPDATIRVSLRQLATSVRGGGAWVDANVPGPFRMDHVLMDEYEVAVSNLPKGAYLKDVAYGGLSVHNRPLRTGPGPDRPELRIVLGRDGGFVTAQVSDDKGRPIPQATVLVAAAGTRSEAEFAAAITAGITDQAGAFRTGALAPGNYLALAASSRIDYSPETIGRLWRARIKAKEIAVAAGQTVQLSLSPPVE